MRKNVVLMLVTCLIVSSLSVLVAPSVTAQAGYQPFVPQFTVKLVDNSYVVPPYSTTTVDQYTGKETTTTSSGYRVEQRSIEITIKNQPFTPYTDSNGNEYNLYYAAHFKGHFGDEWDVFCQNTVQSDSVYTVLIGTRPANSYNYADDTQLDFRVQAIIGHTHRTPIAEDRPYLNDIIVTTFVVDTSSDWSRVQTFTLTSGGSSSTPSQTAIFPPVTSEGNGQPQFPEQTQPPNRLSNPFFLLGVGALLGGVVVAAVMAYIRRHIKTSTFTNDPTQNSANVELSLKRFSPPSTMLARCEC